MLNVVPLEVPPLLTLEPEAPVIQVLEPASASSQKS